MSVLHREAVYRETVTFADNLFAHSKHWAIRRLGKLTSAAFYRSSPFVRELHIKQRQVGYQMLFHSSYYPIDDVFRLLTLR